MSDHFQRALHLWEVRRMQTAIDELRAGLAEEPDSAWGHAALARCLADEPATLNEALAEAQQAVTLDPTGAYQLQVLALVLLKQGRLKAAEVAINSAIALDPEDASLFACLASILMNQERYKESLAATEHGLAVDPTSAGCASLRTIALSLLNRNAEAAQSSREGLALEPNDATMQVWRGLTLMSIGDHGQSIGHFREALRIDPQSNTARHGLINGLLSQYAVFRWSARAGQWIFSRGTIAWVVLFIPVMVGVVTLTKAIARHPQWAWALGFVLLACLVLILAVLSSGQVFKSLLLFDPTARRLLNRSELRGALVAGAPGGDPGPDCRLDCHRLRTLLRRSGGRRDRVADCRAQHNAGIAFFRRLVDSTNVQAG